MKKVMSLAVVDWIDMSISRESRERVKLIRTFIVKRFQIHIMISYHKQWTTASLLIRTCAENT
jgi:hypothetical protein